MNPKWTILDNYISIIDLKIKPRLSLGFYHLYNLRAFISYKLFRHTIDHLIVFSYYNKYKACFTDEVNPNNNRVSEYLIELGEDEKEVEKFIREEVEKFYINNGKNENQKYVFTINPIYHLREET